ncbi:MAG: DJ-1/PfpI family protein [Defluviitaleaceae bacterium]|nr:DJ-1/PfpI family protein [Defluviitaleaceae bacterium]
MQKKEVLLLLTDHWADWEAANVIAGITMAQTHDVKTISIDKNPKVSIGGLRTEIDYTIEEYKNLDNLAMIILVGGFSWGENIYQEIADFVKKANNLNIPVAAICGATQFLAKHGFLDNAKHTGDEYEYFMEQLKDEKGYKGHANFVVSQLVNDKGFITANETSALEFACEILKVLEVYPEEELAEWYKKYKNGLAN